MKVIKTYICECNREFSNPQSFNGHKSHCKIHMIATNKYDKFLQDDNIRHKKQRATIQYKKINQLKIAEQNSENNTKIWKAKNYTCEKCGKVMTEKFGSGRFCSRACANSRNHSEETKNKIKLSNTGKTSITSKVVDREIAIELYNQSPKYCIDCNTSLPFERRKKDRCLDCADIHKRQLLSINSKKWVEIYGGNINKFGTRGWAKYGWYKGFHCDSSFELAYVVYCLEHGVNIQRNKQGFEYEYNDKKHLYYPDFIVDNTYIEIKNYWSSEVQAKINYFPKNLKYKILYKKDLANILSFVIEKYGHNYTATLYDRTLPSYLDKNKK